MPIAAPDIVLKNRDGSVVPVAPQHVLPTDRVRYVGAAVAFVIAESVAAAKDAAEAVVVDYEPLPLKILATAAAESNAPRLYEDVPNLVIDSDVGDSAAVAAAFARAAHVTRLDRPVRGSCELFCAHDRPTALSEHAI
jgi:aerobic carbon-monoxide dehydrogenase large subunit